ncbi:thymidylate kinase [Frankia sp. R82]|uniref:thymidylate kinase n=1 Tax=Frankia sp. R82 TaxID=2950553 RepID=UPI0020445592|nr:thymidylate kinase [Frankia sp. R82]MCM3887165.1 thymidylate kinase [Frankia sp. R82]
MPIIALVGVDGAGKTTQARRLAAALSAAGQPARYHENGGGRPLLDPLARRLGRRDGPDLLGARGHLAVEATIRATAITIALVLSWLRGEIAIMDRYTYCQFATMRLRAHLATDNDGTPAPTGTIPPVGRPDGAGLQPAAARGEDLVRAAYRYLPVPDLVVWLTAPAEVARRRVELRGRDREDRDRLVAFAAAYASLPEAASFHQLPATGTPDDIHHALLRLVHATLDRQRLT